MTVFGRPVTVTPLKSQPLAPPYLNRGIWTVTSVDILTEDGGTLSSISLKLGIRLADFVTPPAAGDWFSSLASDLPLAYWQSRVINGNSTVDFIVDVMTPDGQGGAVLTLKMVIR
jgi:hypothetical protein